MNSHRMPRATCLAVVSALLVLGSMASSRADIPLRDDDGDGFQNCAEGCDLRVSTRGTDPRVFQGPSHQPAVVSAADRVALTWWQESAHEKALFLALFDAAGGPLLAETEIDEPESSGPAVAPAIVWNGIDLAIAWIRRFRVAFARFTPAGARIGEVVEIENPDSEETDAPSLVWGGSEYGLFWRNHFSDSTGLAPFLAFTRISAVGQPAGQVVRLSDIPTRGGIASVWTGREYVAAWSTGEGSDAEIFLTRVDGFGTKQGTDIRLTRAPGFSGAPALAWTGRALILVWEDRRDGFPRIYLARFAADGTRLTSDLRLSEPSSAAASPASVWTGSKMVASWEETRTDHVELELARLSTGGVRIATDLFLGDDDFASGSPSLTWTGSGPVLAWVDSRDLEPLGLFGGEVYLRRVLREDCDDTDSGTWPGANEVCDGRDNDCDGVVDEDCADARSGLCDSSSSRLSRFSPACQAETLRPKGQRGPNPCGCLRAPARLP